MRRLIVAAVAAVFLGGLFMYWTSLRPILRMGAGYKAKVACSEIFVGHRDAEDVLGVEFIGMPDAMKKLALRVDPDAKTVIASTRHGLGKRIAVYRQDYGCTLEEGGPPAALPTLAPIEPAAPWPVAGEDAGWPEGVDAARLAAAIEKAFTDNQIGNRALLVIKDGVIIGEGYADGFSKTTPMLSWSMAKSVTASLVGAAVHAGYLDMDEPFGAPEWRGDPAREAITWDDMMRMSSGLAFKEDYYDPLSDVSRMLWDSESAGAAAAAQPLIHTPGEYWDYSSGTTNLIARGLARVLAEESADINEFSRSALLAPLGASSFVLEPDPSGVVIGSSFVYATPRDWARLGQLYLDNGAVKGERLLPDDWAAYVSSPTPASKDQYGAQFWLNRKDTETGGQSFPGLPESAYFMNGHEGQFVIMIPSARMVIVRLGMTRGEPSVRAAAPLIAEIYQAANQPEPDSETAGISATGNRQTPD